MDKIDSGIAGNHQLEASEHEYMAKNYVNPMAEYLTSVYNIPIKNAIALAWSGLADASSYINSNEFEYPGGMMSKTEMSGIYADYIIKSQGIPVCN